SRASRQRVRLLDPIRGDVILPTGPYRFLARNLQRFELLSGQAGASGHRPGSQQVDLVLSQRTSPRRALPGTVLHGPGAFPHAAANGCSQARLSLQEPAALARLDYYLALLVAVPLGPVPPYQGRGQSACAPGSRRLLAALRAAHPGPRQ